MNGKTKMIIANVNLFPSGTSLNSKELVLMGELRYHLCNRNLWDFPTAGNDAGCHRSRRTITMYGSERKLIYNFWDYLPGIDPAVKNRIEAVIVS
jgi:hypothetical protein